MPPCIEGSGSFVLSFLDEALLAQLLDSLRATTGHVWHVEEAESSETEGALCGVAVDVRVDGDVPCRLRCAADRLPPEHLALVQSIAGLLAVCIAQRLACAREQLHRIATEAALADHGKRMMLLADSLPVLIHAHDKDGRYVFWNKECERVIGFTAEQVLSGDFPGVSWMYAAYADPMAKYHDIHDSGRDYRDMELTLRCADGEFRTFAWTNISRQCPIPGWSGWEVGMDITARLQTDRALQEQLRFMESLIQAVPYPLYIKDTSLRYVGCNQAFAEFAGRSMEAMRGLTAFDLLKEEDARQVEAFDLEVLASGDRRQCEVLFPHADGSVRNVLLEKKAFYGNSASPRGLICVFTDITEQRRHEQQLLRAKQQAEQASQAKTRFLANISHELRTPLNGIMGATELLLAEELTQDQREYLGMVRSSTTNLLRILNDILDLSSLDEGRLAITALPCNLPRALEGLFKLFAVQAQWKRLQFSWTIEEDVPRNVVLDMERLRQALSNIFWNALKFTEQGEIAIRVCLEPADFPELDPAVAVPLRIEIQDTGIGIAPDQQARIFEAFSLAENVMTKKYGGAGLGLAISHKLAALMGGRLWVESEEGAGSTFFMALPVALP
ncbi:ATP-binding protein [Megalodesulfovibrio gigas]|nr:ATP-binding protein [Megalodesulfovibrio gigas]